jgi:hypothetical protein
MATKGGRAMQCMPCAKGDHSGGAWGTPGVQGKFMIALGCTRKLHSEVFAVCLFHQKWIGKNYDSLVCAQCADQDQEIFFIDGIIWEAVNEM